MESMKKWTEIFRAGPWEVMDFKRDNLTSFVNKKNSAREDIHYRIALTAVGDMELELIEANETVPIYYDFLKKTGGGVHHIQERISNEDLPSEMAHYEKRGMEDSFGADYYDSNFHYPDTVEQLGVQIEFSNCLPNNAPKDIIG